MVSLLVLVVFLIFFGKPRSVDLFISPFLDSFEQTDYKNEGKVRRDYLAWKDKKYKIEVLYRVNHFWKRYPLNWKQKVNARLENVSHPEGFYLSTMRKGEWEETPAAYVIELKNSHSFFVKVEQIDNYVDLSSPQLVTFTLTIQVNGTKIWKSKLYEFLIGNDLGDSWVAFDPGTTATSIAFKNDNGDISMAKDMEDVSIIPSVLLYDKEDSTKSFYGTKAVRRVGNTSRFIGFRSIKKLLGYVNVSEENGQAGKKIAAKLLNDIYNDLKKNNLAICKSKRAVVAIPNNYTATKIKDMLFCIESLNQFKEIRPVYEAEAVIFYYMSNKSRLEATFDCKGEKSNETILVFDMGGATINTTIAQISKSNKDVYEVNILSKIGYGIGGDSIDYCILRSIFDFAGKVSYLQEINIFDRATAKMMSKENYDNIREHLIELAFDIKKELVANIGNQELISANQLELYFGKRKSSNSIQVDVNSDFYRIFKTKSKYCILKNDYFRDLIYGNVSDSIREVSAFAGNPKIDKIILSGRSSCFPYIEANILDSFAYSPAIIDLTKIGCEKTAVAEGACWYGQNKNCIRLKNLTTSANFGFVKTMSPDKADIRFETLIMAGQPFADRQQGQVKSTEHTTQYKDIFNFDGSCVNFYQVMGSDSEKIIAGNHKHKYSKIATIVLAQESERIGMRVNENDDVNCSVKFNSGTIIKERGVIADQEIKDANMEHYTWIVK